MITNIERVLDNSEYLKSDFYNLPYVDDDNCYVKWKRGYIEDLFDMIKTMTEEITQESEEEWEHSTWTFYKLATIKGYVTLRWFGISNGYYSESVDFVKIMNEE